MNARDIMSARLPVARITCTCQKEVLGEMYLIRESCNASTKTPIINNSIANKGRSPSGALNMKNLEAVEAIFCNPKV
jgi:hypothetical protein|tara:strand:- start:706 stop:936 length:231 start_codon:yes stop_codon:yes gene_type:complete